jgi:UDP-N-acetylmuramoyl-tripeptide--D-alanyl-D-alanine ligase
MLPITVKEILEATGGNLLQGDPAVQIDSLCTDSRSIKEDDFFVPIIGENFDGHKFIQSALESGALGSLTQYDIPINSEGIVIRVKDTLKALWDIARYYRSRFDIKVIAVTGSAGKTTTKDMIYEVLSKNFNVLKTQGNFNNHIGLPLTLLNLSKEYQIAVVEMGMNNFGEISNLTKIARPDIGVITNIGTAHIGNLGSRQNILKAKMEILDGMNPDGMMVLNGDDDLLWGLRDSLKVKTLYFGTREGVDIQAQDIKTNESEKSSCKIKFEGAEYNLEIFVPGIHNIYNALSAIAIGLNFGVALEDMIDAIGEFKSGKMRMNVLKLNEDIKIINDTYNANPDSMEAALIALKDMKAKRRIAVLGDMLELGELSMKLHRELGKKVAQNGMDYLITLGQQAKYIAEGAIEEGMPSKQVIDFREPKEIIDYIQNLLMPGDAALIKGSRGMKMEQIVDKISQSRKEEE